MSDGPPPGYNPNVSMLQGGTAPITPQAGGGAVDAPPPGYNPSVSLLNGGTAQITPQAGGATAETIRQATDFVDLLITQIGAPNIDFNKREEAIQFTIDKIEKQTFDDNLGPEVINILLEPTAAPALAATPSPEGPGLASSSSPQFSAPPPPQQPIVKPTPQSAFRTPTKQVRFQTPKPATKAASTQVDDTTVAAAAASLQVTAKEAETLLNHPELTAEQKAQIEVAMKEAFATHLATIGEVELETGKTLEEVNKEAAAAALTAGALLARTFLGEREDLSPESDEDEESSAAAAAEPKYKPFGRIIARSESSKSPFYLEYYRIFPVTESNASTLQFMINYAQNNYSTREWKAALLAQMNQYEARRKSELWAPTALRGRTEKRMPQFAKAGYSLNSSQILTQFDRAVYELPTDMPEGLTLIAAPPVRGDIGKFLNILRALQRINVLSVSDDASSPKPVLKLKKGVVLAFMPPFYSPALDLVKGKVNVPNNILLLSHFLDIEAVNQNRVFVLAEATTENYAVGVSFDQYRKTGAPRETALLNFLEPSYIVFNQGSNDGTGGVLLSASTDVERNLPTEEPALPRLFRPKPTADGKFAESPIVVRSIDLGNSQTFTIPEKNFVGGSACTAKGLVSRVEGGVISQNPKLNPIFLKKLRLKDAVGSEREDDILLVFRLIYDTSQSGKAICEYSNSRTIQPPMPPDQFYGSKSAATKGVAYTQVKFFDSIINPERSPIYLVRKPTFGTAVFSDWFQQKFTVDEANLLNGMGLSPKLLEEVFKEEKKNWQNELANFLKGISISMCFRDTRLMLRAECEQNRDFMDKVRAHFAKNNMSLESIQTKREQEMKAEIKRYLEDLETREGAKGADAFPGEDDEHLVEIDGPTFLKNKRKMDTLFVYHEIPVDGLPRVSTNVIVASQGGNYKFYKVSVPAQQYEENPFIFYDLLQTKRALYPSLSFIY